MDLTFGQRLEHLKNHFKLSNRALGKVAGVSGQQIANLIDGTSKNPKKNLFDNISSQLGISYSWLLNGVGDMLILTHNENDHIKDLNSIRNKNEVTPASLEEGEMELRYFDMRVSATFKDLCSDLSNFWEWEKVSFYDKKYLNAVIFKVDGDSMEDQIKDGTKVLCTPVSKSDWKYQSGGVYVIAFGSQFVIKRIIDNSESKQQLVLKSDNPKYGTQEVAYKEIHCMWKVEETLRQRVR